MVVFLRLAGRGMIGSLHGVDFGEMLVENGERVCLWILYV